MSKNIKCVRQDGTEVWLNPKTALDKNLQRQMGFMPMSQPDQAEEIIKSPPVEEEVEDAPDLAEIGEAEEHAGNVSDKESTYTDMNESPEISPEEEMKALRYAYKKKFGKFPPSNWKTDTIKKKIDA